MTLYMVGHSIHPWAAFKKLLDDNQIATLVDVRSSARSRNPQFNESYLRANLAPIVYQHRPALGGKRPLPIDRLKRELETLLGSYSATQRMCLMCSEGDYRDCHRHYLLAPLVMELGWEVLQIGRDGSLTEDLGPTAKTLCKMQAFLPQ